jgi:type VI secretion system protein ImpG
MDPTLAGIYDLELTYLKEACAEFAAERPLDKIAGRLDLSPDSRHISRDPYVNMLLQGVAFLSARVRHQLEADFPRLAHGILEVAYPHFLRPVPSMGIVGFLPKKGDPRLLRGCPIPAGTVLRSSLAKGEATECRFRTAHQVELWPFVLKSAEYLSRRTLGLLSLPESVEAAAALRLTLETHRPELQFRKLSADDGGRLGFDRLVLHLRDDGAGYRRGPSRKTLALYEQFFARAVGVAVQWERDRGSGGGSTEARATRLLPVESIRRVGFELEEALLPVDDRSFQGFRLLREYFAFPDRFSYVGLEGLRDALAGCDRQQVDIVVLLKEEDPRLEGAGTGRDRGWSVSTEDFELFTTPVINLFEHPIDRISLDERTTQYRVVVDHSRPLAYELYAIESLTGYGSRGEEREFRPFYALRHDDQRPPGYYLVHRQPRRPTPRETAFGQAPAYLGSEVYLQLVDPLAAPFSPDLRQLSLSGLCTNRHLGELIPVSQGETDFRFLKFDAPVERKIRCLAGPTPPIPAPLDGNAAWRLISHLSLNFRTLVDRGKTEGAAALREMLHLYLDDIRRPIGRQLEGLRSAQVTPVTRQIRVVGPATYARGLEVNLVIDEDRFGDSGPFLLAAVLEEFLTRYASINSFAETVLTSVQRGQIKHWPARLGRRPTL